MAKLLFGLVACVAAFAVVESLTCQRCSLSVWGICLNNGTETCAANNTCYKGGISIVGSFSGFQKLGCRETTGCNTTTNNTLLGVTFTTNITCCSTDNCNNINAAPSTKMTFSAVIGAAVLASVLGSIPL
uniref:UPAR/Ly6 domain-containing protein n=1 Tax=Gouania willdenowi TaxID=441366 RepID=A0A8C5GDL9_GOUWI